MSLSIIYTIELRLDVLDNLNIITKVLILVNTRFRAISSLLDIIIEVYNNSLSSYIRRKIENYE
jgi:hypothetical protein